MGSRFLSVAVLAAATSVLAHPGLHHDIGRVGEQIAREPERADLYVERAFLERLDSQPEAALRDLERARRIAPDDRRVFVETGMALAALHRDREADEELTRFLDSGPATAPALAERAHVRARLGRKKEAIADLTKSITLRPDLEAYLERGSLQEAIGDYDAARSGYRDGLARLGGAVNLRLALLRLDVSRRAYDEALVLVDEGMAQSPVKTEWYLRRAEVLEAAGKKELAKAERDRALAEAQRVIETRPTGIHLVSRAKVYLALGRKDDARRDLVAALEKAPRYAEARTLLDGLGGKR